MQIHKVVKLIGLSFVIVTVFGLPRIERQIFDYNNYLLFRYISKQRDTIQ